MTTNDDVKVITNNHQRPVLDAYELTPAEREEFDYLDWDAIERGEASGSFIRYQGQTYDLGEFQTTSGMPEFSPLTRWHGYMSDTFFSGVLVRYSDDFDYVTVGRFYS